MTAKIKKPIAKQLGDPSFGESAAEAATREGLAPAAVAKWAAMLDEAEDQIVETRGSPGLSACYLAGMIARIAIPLERRIAELEERAKNAGYRGAWKAKTLYRAGSFVSRGGSMWHCNEDSQDEPGTSEAWTLCVKRGRDGNRGTAQ